MKDGYTLEEVEEMWPNRLELIVVLPPDLILSDAQSAELQAVAADAAVAAARVYIDALSTNGG